jgi:hypothetical protein
MRHNHHVRLAVLALVTACVLGAASQAQAVTFTPNPADIYDLRHANYYSWGIAYTVPTGQEIVSATLKIFNINDTQYDPSDALYIHLLDNPALGVSTFSDPGSTVDNWAGQGPLIAKYQDQDYLHSENKTYDLSTLGLLDELNTFAANGVFGFGFDPDCKYTNTGVQFCLDIATVPHPSLPPVVPEPVTMAGLMLGVGAIVTYVRRRR